MQISQSRHIIHTTWRKFWILWIGIGCFGNNLQQNVKLHLLYFIELLTISISDIPNFIPWNFATKIYGNRWVGGVHKLVE